MKGIIFNTVEETVTELFNAETWDDLVDSAGVSGSYTALGTYPDSELIALVGAACHSLGLPAEEVLQTLGRHGFKILASQVENLINKEAGVFEFLASVHDIIHVEVAKLVPDAQTPDVITEAIDESNMRVSYTSERNMPALAHGLMLGAGDFFSEELDIRVESTEGNTTVFKVSKV